MPCAHHQPPVQGTKGKDQDPLIQNRMINKNIYIYNTYINRICVCIYIYDYICIHGQTCRYQLPTLLRLYLGLVLGLQRHSQKVFGAQEIQYTCTCVCVRISHACVSASIVRTHMHIACLCTAYTYTHIHI